MTDRTSYPSPNAAATRAGAPFYPSSGMSPTADAEVPDLHLHHADHDQDDKDDAALTHLHEQLTQHINPELQTSAEQAQDPNLMQVDSDNGHNAQAMAREVMNLNPDEENHSVPHFGVGNHTPKQDTPATPGATVTPGGKLRSKVSRACDECRRKKIRCDATVENENASCTACKKSNQICQFSRTPQKRGPSKGYIKELADRVTSLEGQLLNGHGPAMTTQDQTHQMDLRNDESPMAFNRLKRGRSDVDGTDDHYTNTERTGFPPHQPSFGSGEITELDEQLSSTYYQSLHPVLPILPNDPNDLRQYISEMPTATRTALLMSMNATLRSTPYSGILEINPVTDNGYSLLNMASITDRPLCAHIQALIMLMLGANNHGSELFREGSIVGLSPERYLCQAITLGEELHIFEPSYLISIDGTREFEMLRSLAVCIGVLNTLNVFAMKKPSSLKNLFLVPVMRKDITIVGQRTFWLAKFCAELCDMQALEVVPEEQEKVLTWDWKYMKQQIGAENISSLTSARKAFMKIFDTYSEVSNMESDHIVAMCFWYCNIILDLHFYPLLEPSRLLYACRRTAELISQLPVTNPLLHHFAGLTAHVIIQLADFTETRTEAIAILETLDNALHNLVPVHTDQQSCEALVRDAVSRKRNSLVAVVSAVAAAAAANATDASSTSPSIGLEHLANAAVGSDGAGTTTLDVGDGGVAAAAEAAAKAAMGMGVGAAAAAAVAAASTKEWDPMLMSREGYLLALSR